MSRAERLMPGGIPKYIRCYDNGGKTTDRYTIVFTGNYAGRRGCDVFGCSGHPSHPQGVGIHDTYDTIIDRPRYSHLGKRVTFDQLPAPVQKHIYVSYRDLWRLTQPLVHWLTCIL